MTGSMEHTDSAVSPCSSITSYDYNPDDFPKVCEIEEFRPPSFSSAPSAPISRSQSLSSPSASIQHNKNTAKKIKIKIAAKLQTKIDLLQILLSLSEAAGAVHDSSSIDVVAEAWQTLDKTFDLVTKVQVVGKASLKIVDELETAIAKVSDLLLLKWLLAEPIQLAGLAARLAGEVLIPHSSYEECQEVKSKAERLGALLWDAARTDLYEQPTRRFTADAKGTLETAVVLVNKCRPHGNIVGRLFPSTLRPNSLKNISLELDNAIGNFTWLLRVCKPSFVEVVVDDCDIEGYLDPTQFAHIKVAEVGDNEYLSLPPMAAKEPLVCLIWEKVAKLLKGSPKDKVEATLSLKSLVFEHDCSGLVIEAGAVEPLLKLVKEGHNYVQVTAALTVSQLAAHFHHFQNAFAQHNAVEVLVQLLLNANETARVDIERYTSTTNKDPAAGRLKVIAAKALFALAKGNYRICKTILDS